MRTKKQLEQRIAALEAAVARLGARPAPLVQHMTLTAPEAVLSSEAADQLRKRIRQMNTLS